MITSGQSNHSIRASFLSACLAFSLLQCSLPAADLSAPSDLSAVPDTAQAGARQAGKPTCAVLNFDAQVGITKEETVILSERFAIEFGKLGKYQLISRSKMKEVLEFQKFARSDNCSATECAIEAGKILSAQFMVYGSIGKVGGTWTVNAALVSVETGEITSQASVDVKGAVDDLLSSGMLSAARQLAGLGALALTTGVGAVQDTNQATPGQPLTVDLGGGVTMELVWISAGEFMMGSDDGDSDEKPVHRVKITKGFWIGKYEVTQEQWERVMGDNPSRFKGSDLPVEQVSWNDCQEFMERLKAEVRRMKVETMEFRLPTEAEWEYACRAGTTTKYHTGDSESDLGRAGWYGSNSGKKTHLVGGKDPNTRELFDMHGNVWEWCADWYADYGGDTQDPVGPTSGSGRVLRGGSWRAPSEFCRSASRSGAAPSDRGRYDPAGRPSLYGFRVVVSR